MFLFVERPVSQELTLLINMWLVLFNKKRTQQRDDVVKLLGSNMADGDS